MKKTLLLLFLLSTLSNFAQSKKIIYVDEAYETIDFFEFTKKKESNLFHIATTQNDTAIFKKLRYKEYFGTLEAQKKSQLNKYFHTNYAIDSTKTWLIHYKDTLPNPKTMPKASGMVFIDGSTTKHKHVQSFEDYQKAIPNEKKTYSKYENVDLIHFYNVQNDFPVKTENYEWHQDKGLLLKNLFNDGMKAYRTIIIHPNGNFYVTATRKTQKELKNILVVKKYEKTKKKTIKKFDKLNSKKP